MDGPVRNRGEYMANEFMAATSPAAKYRGLTPPTHLPINYTAVSLKPHNNEASRNVLGGLVRYRGDPTHHINAPSAITQNRLQAAEDILHLAVLLVSHSPSTR